MGHAQVSVKYSAKGKTHRIMSVVLGRHTSRKNTCFLYIQDPVVTFLHGCSILYHFLLYQEKKNQNFPAFVSITEESLPQSFLEA